MKTRF